MAGVLGLLGRLWADDGGAVLSAELVMVMGVLVFGAAGSAVALRNEVTAGLSDAASGLRGVVPDPADVRRMLAQPPPRVVAPAWQTAAPLTRYALYPPAPPAEYPAP